MALQTRAASAPGPARTTRPLVPMVQDYGAETVVIDGGGVRGGQAVLGSPQLAAVPRASFDPGNSSVSSEVAVIAFAPGAAALSSAAKAELASVAALRSQVDGAIRIVGKGDNAAARANAVARELRRLGVPAQRVFAGGADGAEAGNEAEIFLDY
jgi:outer membrane protein OmpA-like peptidoglycan-associated protein